MHEFSLCQQIIKIIEKFGLSVSFDRILVVYIEVGELVAVEKSALLLAFAVLAKNTKAQGARLEVVEIPGQGVCELCLQSFRLVQRFQYCCECENALLTITQGDELRVSKIEVQ